MRWLVLLWLAAQAPPPQLPAPKYARPAPAQPIPFSHRQHISVARLECRQCHEIPDPGDFAGIPATAKCMACHVAIKKESEPIQRLAAFHKDAKPVPWARVYRIPDYVFFSHKQHVAKGTACEACHGQVRERDVLSREKDISMAACMECHRATSASIACDFCHEPK
ncbi:MAG: cytochrome c3 family protein [Bryobacteraceae bacterium]